MGASSPCSTRPGDRFEIASEPLTPINQHGEHPRSIVSTQEERSAVAKFSFDGAEFWLKRRVARAWQLQRLFSRWPLDSNHVDYESACPLRTSAVHRCIKGLRRRGSTPLAIGARGASVRASFGDWSSPCRRGVLPCRENGVRVHVRRLLGNRRGVQRENQGKSFCNFPTTLHL
jgi:hypothetical protein